MACTSSCTESFSLDWVRRMTIPADMLVNIQHLGRRIRCNEISATGH
jgi:hypothetical protein